MPPVTRKRVSSKNEQVNKPYSAAKKKKLDVKPQKNVEKREKKENIFKSPKTLTDSSCKKSRSTKKKLKPQPSDQISAKEELVDTQTQHLVQDTSTLNIAQLLALGETSQSTESVNETILSEKEESSETEDSDLEEVQNSEVNEPVIPKEGVNITLNVPDLNRKKRKKEVDLEAHLRRQVNRVKKDIQLLMHKVHLLCWIAHIKFVNETLNSPTILEACAKMIKSKNLYPSKYSDLSYLEGILKWFHKNIEFKKGEKDSKCSGGLLKELLYQIEFKISFSSRDFTLLFISFLRVLGLKARIIMSLQVLPVKPASTELLDTKIKKENLLKVKNESDISQISNQTSTSFNSSNYKVDPKIENDKVLHLQTNCESESKSKRKLSKTDDLAEVTHGKKANLGADKNDNLKPSTSKANKKAKSKLEKTISKIEDDDDDDDDEFIESKHFKSVESTKHKKLISKNYDEEIEKKSESKKGRTKSKTIKSKKTNTKNSNQSQSDTDTDDDFVLKSLNKTKNKKTNRLSTSSNEELQTKRNERCDTWCEVYLEAEEKWISVDVSKQKIHCTNELYSRATHPVVYVIACNNNFTLKDITKRYVPHWHSDTRKKRVDEEWWNQTMRPYLPPKNAQDKEEDEDIDRQLSDKPLPPTISEYKDHPLYALKRHLLKFEAIYPPDAPTMGFVRGEPIYARECVVTLHSREMWYKQARVVRLKEEPYKIVKARPKYDRVTGEMQKPLPLELFGIWQTEDYIPPIAVDGKVPRNEYGNVDLFKPCMLPIGTVHLQIPSLNRVARKLGIDCAAATVGFEFHSGGSHPVFDGFVVCEEFKDILLDTWNKEVDESAKRNEEKREKRIYGNWRRLIRGLLIREKLKLKYSFGDSAEGTAGCSSSTDVQPFNEDVQ